jgi:hypothetical protein
MNFSYKRNEVSKIHSHSILLNHEDKVQTGEQIDYGLLCDPNKIGQLSQLYPKANYHGFWGQLYARVT